jgi:hypothetical protein
MYYVYKFLKSDYPYTTCFVKVAAHLQFKSLSLSLPACNRKYLILQPTCSQCFGFLSGNLVTSFKWSYQAKNP